jgi:holo-[acyl-carrier protein] synthase
MIAGIGLDIVEIDRIQKIYDQYGDAFVKRILCDNEYDDYVKQKFASRFIARRFAAKEAVAKALGTGFSAGITMSMICVTHDESGKPVIKLYDKARERADALGVENLLISLSDERRYATAFAVIER